MVVSGGEVYRESRLFKVYGLKAYSSIRRRFERRLFAEALRDAMHALKLKVVSDR